MIEKKNPEEEIFYRALALGAGENRTAYIIEACGADSALRREVEGLLDAHEEPATFLNETRVDNDALSGDAADLAEKPGDMIGRYKLLQQIGEGGFGSVWMAEQTVPITRRVALKIIKLGMDTREVIARFEAERQALAMMDHHHIAKVLDAGATDTGRPYFVMELVRGISITRFCDERKLGTRARLELYLEVCAAVNHAHQKGLIHRDLKPNNILVTLVGNEPVPKVIDFGIAKATQTKLTDKTLFTRFEQFVGTPVYMSPEQAAISGLDVDTRTDIYSLGVLLYELLTGKLPFSPETLKAQDYDQLRKIIREYEPPKPSSRLSTLAEEERTQVATTHQADPNRLHKLVRSDLDWIVMKAMDKDRTRRYETVNALAMDVQRFLGDEPVLAAAPSTAYRLQRFARRNKGVVTAVSAVMLALVMGLAFSILQLRKARYHESTAIAAAGEAESERARADEEAKKARSKQAELTKADKHFKDWAESFTMVLKRITNYPSFPTESFTPEILRIGIRASDTAWDVYDEVSWVLQPLRDRMEQELQRTVVIKVVVYRDYQKLIDAMGRGEIDFMRSGSNAYILAQNIHKNLRLLARHDAADLRDLDGNLIDRPGRVIIGKNLMGRARSFEELAKLVVESPPDKKIRVAFGNTFSGSGRIRLQEILARHRITAEHVEWRYYPRHKDVAKAVADNKADIGGIKYPTFRDYFGNDGKRRGDAQEFSIFDYSPAIMKEEGGKGKPWVAGEDLDKKWIGDKNLFETLQTGLCNLKDYYEDFWQGKEVEKGSEHYKEAPPDEYPLNIVATTDSYYNQTRAVRLGARKFFEGFAKRIVNGRDKFFKRLREQATPEELMALSNRLEDVLRDLDEKNTLDYTILAIHYFRPKPSYADIADELVIGEWEVRKRYGEVMRMIKGVADDSVDSK